MDTREILIVVNKKQSRTKKVIKIVARVLLGLLLLLLISGILLTLPAVQTRIAHYFTEKINRDFKTRISVDKVAFTVFGGVKLRNVLIQDHHTDTLIYAGKIQTNILDFAKLTNGDLLFGKLKVDKMFFNLKQYKHEKDTNLDNFIALFNSGKPSSKQFLMKASKVYITDSRFTMMDGNTETEKTIDLRKMNASLENFRIFGTETSMDIKNMNLVEHHGLVVKNLKTHFVYNKRNMVLGKLTLLTDNSLLKGNIIMRYNRDNNDFADFNNKVQFDIKLDSTILSTNDIRYFTKEFGPNESFTLSSQIKGTLDDFTATNLDLRDSRNSKIIGDVNFKNLFDLGNRPFFMKGNFENIASSYDNLVQLLPNVLGKKLPTTLRKLGNFSSSGFIQVTTTTIDAKVVMSTSLGKVRSKLAMRNIDNIDNASYSGTVATDNFNIGSFLGMKDLGFISMDVYVDGKGFTEKNLSTKISGDVFRFDYNGYKYSKILVDGSFKAPIFEGNLVVNDPNLFMDFQGLLNLRKKETQYNFHAAVDYADLYKLNFMKDSISVFKGDVTMDITGNTIDTMQGIVHISQSSYQNQNDIYVFDDFIVESRFGEDNLRTITINSPDIIDGNITGRFEFGEVKKMVENSLGSLYANYRPNKVKPGQFIKFDFNIYSKIVEILLPSISIAKNTSFRGSINSDSDAFKFNFSSPQVKAYNYTADNIGVEIDNKNPLFNAFVSMDTIKNSKYKIRDFSLINITKNDTLFLRSEFKGGINGDDSFNLNLFHTINAENQNVVGIQKSELKYQDVLWYLNEEDNGGTVVVFDKKLQNLSISPVVMSHENQQVSFTGMFKGADYKDLKLDFKQVELEQLIPKMDNLSIKGALNGIVNFKQSDKIYRPTASVRIDSLNINDIELGNLTVDVEGDPSFSTFNVNSSLYNRNLQSFNAQGKVAVNAGKTNLDLDVNFDSFNIGILSSIGGDVLSNIRGFASGRTTVEGNLDNLAINGRLFLAEAGMGISYLNIDYGFDKSSIVDVTSNKFIFRNMQFTDTKYQTEGVLNGFIEHTDFSDWKLDIGVESKRLLVLDTEDSEDAAYFGTAFIDGTATIKGPVTGLFINVDARSERGTTIKIPINDAAAVGDNNYIHWITPAEKKNIKLGIVDTSRNYNGLEMDFEFDIDQNAEIEVILDRSSGHGMKGRGVGGLVFKINTLGKFNMWGDFQVYEGTYNFKYGGLINKRFDVKKYGSIVWEGDPMRAILNLEAVYKTTANPALLLDNAVINRKVPVEVIIGLHGNLTAPEPDFDINFPTVSSVLKSEIQTKLDDKDIRQKQALILLSTGSFLSADGVNQSSITNNLYEKVSDVFGDIFNDGDGKVIVGVDIVSADRTPGTEADGRFGVTVSTRLNERITVNGKLGVPVGGISQSAIVGDVEVQYRVNEDGSLNLRAFNRENDINYIGQGIGYTQGVGISYEVDFDTFSELIQKIFKNQKPERTDNGIDLHVPDSQMAPEFININTKDKRYPQTVKPNQEAIPTED